VVRDLQGKKQRGTAKNPVEARRRRRKKQTPGFAGGRVRFNLRIYKKSNKKLNALAAGRKVTGGRKGLLGAWLGRADLRIATGKKTRATA